MISKIGSRKKAFTLIEVMVATAILSMALVFIYQIFFTLLNRANYCSYYLKGVWFIEDKAWRAQDELRRLNSMSDPETAGETVFDDKKFNWKLSYTPVPCGAAPLYRIDAVLSWREGGKDAAISRTVYAMYAGEK